MIEPIVSPLIPGGCEPLWKIEQDRQRRIQLNEMIRDLQERLYIERTLKANGIDINELERT